MKSDFENPILLFCAMTNDSGFSNLANMYKQQLLFNCQKFDNFINWNNQAQKIKDVAFLGKEQAKINLELREVLIKYVLYQK